MGNNNKNRLYVAETKSPHLWLTIPTIVKSFKKLKPIKEEVKVPLYLKIKR